MKTSSLVLSGIMAAAACTLVGCGDKEAGSAKLQVVMVDAPATYDAVMVDIQDVQINTGNDAESGWESLEGAELGVIDLLALTNGEEEFLGEIELAAGTLGQIRLILGDQNELVMGTETHALTVPSGSESGLKVNINTTIEEGVTYKLVLDFDAGRSVVKRGNSGDYNLKPVIRAQMEAQTGAIEGVVSPADVQAIVHAIQGEDSVSSYPDENGEYLIRALAEGTYDVIAVPSDEAIEIPTIEDVVVVKGTVTTADTLFLN